MGRVHEGVIAATLGVERPRAGTSSFWGGGRRLRARLKRRGERTPLLHPPKSARRFDRGVPKL
jgi:hypothetical protein